MTMAQPAARAALILRDGGNRGRVPARKAADHAHRFQLRNLLDAGGARGNHAAIQAAGFFGGPFEHFGRDIDFLLRFAVGLAELAGDLRGQPLAVYAHHLQCDLAQQVGALDGALFFHADWALLARVDGALHIVG